MKRFTTVPSRTTSLALFLIQNSDRVEIYLQNLWQQNWQRADRRAHRIEPLASAVGGRPTITPVAALVWDEAFLSALALPSEKVWALKWVWV